MYGVVARNSAAQLSMRLNCGRTPSLRRAARTSRSLLAGELGQARIGEALRLQRAER